MSRNGLSCRFRTERLLCVAMVLVQEAAWRPLSTHCGRPGRVFTWAMRPKRSAPKRSREELLRRIDRVVMLARLHLKQVRAGQGNKANLEAPRRSRPFSRRFVQALPRAASLRCQAQAWASREAFRSWALGTMTRSAGPPCRQSTTSSISTTTENRRRPHTCAHHPALPLAKFAVG